MSKRLVDRLKNSLPGRLLRKIKMLSSIKYKKIYGLTYFDKNDLKYMRQVKKNRLTEKDIRCLKNEVDGLKYKPLISVVMPVYNVERSWLEEAIQSVVNQVYPNWELCIADDASPATHIKEVLNAYKKKDQRINVAFLEKNQGISGASNEALALATGEYVALLDHDDVLSADSLLEVVKLLNDRPEADIIYSDEDKLSMGGVRLRPVIKSDWDPELFLTYNYLCHLVVCRRELIEKVKGFRTGFEGSQDFDLLLRMTEFTSNIYHIPKVLYHWRMIPGSAAAVVDAKSDAFEHGRKALRDALKRRGIKADVLNGDIPGTFRIQMQHSEN